MLLYVYLLKLVYLQKQTTIMVLRLLHSINKNPSLINEAETRILPVQQNPKN